MSKDSVKTMKFWVTSSAAVVLFVASSEMCAHRRTTSSCRLMNSWHRLCCGLQQRVHARKSPMLQHSRRCGMVS